MKQIAIQVLIQAIKAKLYENYGDVKIWRHRDYEEISILIFEKTKLKLSSMTLKRIIGDVEYEFSPSRPTLNALARFIDYNSWDDFQNRVLLTGSKNNGENPYLKDKKTKKRFIYGSLIFFVLIVSLIVISNFRNKEILVKLWTDTPILNAPGVIEFYFDISSIKEDSVFINFGRNINEPIVSIPKASKSCIRNYSMPGIHQVILFSKIKKYDSIPVLVYNKKWDRYVSYLNGYGIVSLSFYDFACDDKFLNIKRDDLKRIKFDTNAYYQSDFRFFDTLPILIDNFTIETRIKNNVHEIKDMSCGFSSIKIYSFNSSIKVNLTDTFCYENAHFLVSENRLAGNRRKYEKLGINVFNWHIIKLVVQNKVATLYIDGVKNMKLPYTKLMGRFCGIQYLFSKTGMLDYVRIYNEKNELIYTNDF